MNGLMSYWCLSESHKHHHTHDTCTMRIKAHREELVPDFFLLFLQSHEDAESASQEDAANAVFVVLESYTRPFQKLPEPWSWVHSLQNCDKQTLFFINTLCRVFYLQMIWDTLLSGPMIFYRRIMYFRRTKCLSQWIGSTAIKQLERQLINPLTTFRSCQWPWWTDRSPISLEFKVNCFLILLGSLQLSPELKLSYYPCHFNVSVLYRKGWESSVDEVLATKVWGMGFGSPEPHKRWLGIVVTWYPNTWEGEIEEPQDKLAT